MFAQILFAILVTIPIFAWSQTQYKVREGDTLLKIADRSLGNTDRSNPSRYDFVKKLIALNPQIKNPNALEPGQIITVPDEFKGEKVEKVEKVTEPMVVLKPAAPETSVPDPKVLEAPVPAATGPETHTEKHSVPTREVQAPAPEAKKVEVHQETKSAEASHEADSHKSAHHNFIFVQPRYQMVEIISKDEVAHTKAKMESESSFGLDLQYGVILNEHFHLLFQGGITNTQFGDLKGVTATVNHKSETLKSLAVGIAYEATSTLHLDFMAFQAEQTFLLPDTATEYKLEAIAIPGAELNISWDYYTNAAHIFGVSAIGEYLSEVKKDGVTYESAFEPFAALYWKSNKGHDHLNYKVTLTYKHGHQETSSTKKAEELTALGVGFYF